MHTLNEAVYKDNCNNAGSTSASKERNAKRKVRMKFFKMLDEGTDKTFAKIAKELKVPRSTIIFWKTKYIKKES